MGWQPIVATGSELESLWKVRKAASPILERLQGPLRSTRIIEDACVHPDNLVAYIQGLKRVFAKPWAISLVALRLSLPSIKASCMA